MNDCPVCDANATPPIWLLRGSRTKKISPVHLCLRCGFLFQRSIYHEDDAALHADFLWHLDKLESHRAHSDRVIADFRGMRPEGNSLLDIGCGVGVSLLAAQKAGVEAVGVEPNHYATEHARNEYGLNVISGYFEKDLLPRKFDFVILDMVLEHVPRPTALMAATFDVLKPGGLLYLAVPSRTKGFARIPYSLLLPRSRRSLFCDNDVHINHFSRSNIERLVSPHGAKIERQVTGGAYYIRAA